MRAIVLVVQVLFWLLVARLLLRAIARLVLGARGPAKAASRGREARRIEDLVQCHACRTHVPGSRAIAARVSGNEERFCSAACRDRAQAEVARAS